MNRYWVHLQNKLSPEKKYLGLLTAHILKYSPIAKEVVFIVRFSPIKPFLRRLGRCYGGGPFTKVFFPDFIHFSIDF